MRIERIEALPEAFGQIKKSLLERFPKENVVGLDLKRVENFVREQGFEVKPYIICQKEELFGFVEPTQSIRLFSKKAIQQHESAGGVYNPVLDMAIVMREEKLESVNSPTYSEGYLVHELMHANSMRHLYVIDHAKMSTPRVGFTLKEETAWGRLLEEGFADIYRARYISRNLPQEQRKTLAKTFQLENLASKRPQFVMEHPVEVNLERETNLSVPLPMKYMSFDLEGRLFAPPPAFAGYAVELLWKSNPEIESLFIKARSSVEGLRKLAQALDAIKPGFYTELQKGEYTHANFMEKLSLVIDTLAQNASAAEKM